MKHQGLRAIQKEHHIQLGDEMRNLQRIISEDTAISLLNAISQQAKVRYHFAELHAEDIPTKNTQEYRHEFETNNVVPNSARIFLYHPTHLATQIDSPQLEEGKFPHQFIIEGFSKTGEAYELFQRALPLYRFEVGKFVKAPKEIRYYLNHVELLLRPKDDERDMNDRYTNIKIHRTDSTLEKRFNARLNIGHLYENKYYDALRELFLHTS